MLGTSATPYDLRFRLFDIPVRVHPLFWLTSALLGGIAQEPIDMPAVLNWIGCLFVSILVHEFGHALMDKRFRGEPAVLLYGLGGLCYPNGHETPAQRLAVLFAGPGAGFVFGAVVLMAASLMFGISPSEHLAVVTASLRLTPNRADLIGALAKLRSETWMQVYWNLIQINLMWGLVNLFPIFPLDGGQATQVVWKLFNRRDGVRRSHILSLVVAGTLAVFAFFADRNDWFLPFFFGILALMNYQVLHSLHQTRISETYEDDQWWRT